MKIHTLSAVFLLLATTTAGAQPPLHYWGTLQHDDGTGVIELDGQLYAVRAGDVVPGRGTVRVVTNEEVIIVHVLSDAEKLELSDHGHAVIDTRQMHVRNVLRMLPMPQRLK